MTISTTIIKNSYSGDGSNDTFAYQFKISTTADMEVIIRSSTGTETTKTLTTDYTVTGAGSASGGNVVFESGDIPTATETVILRRSTTLTQALDLVENDPFTADSVESAFDKNLALLQEQQEELDRSFKVSKSNTISSAEFTTSAADRASKTLGFDSSGDLTTVSDFLPAGGDSAMFQFATATADADPGAGKFRLNHATIASATIIYVDDLEYNGTDVSAWVQSWDDVSGNDTNRGRIRISKANTLDTWHTFKVTGAVTDASGYTKITLVYIDGAGTLAADDKVWIAFSASGEDGAIPGYFYKFDAGTSDADPGAGDIAFNNATYANVTEIYIDDADQHGGATQADTATWGSSTSTIKGFLHIVDINDSSTYARFKITAAVSDESGYNKITVVHLASNNTFSAADELSVHYTRTGLKGDTGSTGSTGSTGATGDVSLAGTQTLTNKTLTSPKINEDVAVTSTATELNLLDALSRGSIIYGNSSAATTVLAKGGAGTVLTSDGTDLSWTAASSTDLTGVHADITALALREATNENSAAFNLPNKFIETFTDDTNLGTQTDGDRVDGYWISSVAGTPVHAVPTGVAIAGGNIVRAAEATAITNSGDGGTGGTSDATAYSYIAYTVSSSVSGYVIVDLGASYSIEKMDLGKGRGAGDPRSILMKYHETQADPQANGTVIDFTSASASSKTYTGSTALLSNFASDGTADWAALAGNSQGTINAVTGFTAFTARYISLKWGSADFHDANANWSEMKFYKAARTINAAGTLIQSANTVASAKTVVSGTMLYKDHAGTATLGTDLKIYFSCNNGGAWTEAASYNAITPVYSSGIKMVRLGETTCTSGTGIIYKAVWANQSSGSKETQLHGIGINY